jgi:hypothetical protein
LFGERQQINPPRIIERFESAVHMQVDSIYH